MAKVLLVDDDALLLRMYHKKLVNDGYEVETASDGEEGLQKVASFSPNLILLDLMMPKMNGIQVLEKLQAEPSTKKIPVVVLTNVSSEGDAEKAIELGAVTYIIKAGNRPDVIVKKVKEVLAGYSKDLPQASEKVNS